MISLKHWILLLGVLGLPHLLRADDTQAGGLTEKPATVAGTRGLNESSETIDTTARDDAAIDRLDKTTVTPEAVDHFIAEGKLQ